MMSETQAPATSLLNRSPSARAARPRACAGCAGGLRHDAELPFGAADEPQQVIARRIQVRAADLDTSPSIVTIFTPSRLFVVTPYFRQCAPPEFIATLPAMAQASWLDGSGA
jgi:hypothetical protein